LAFEFGSKVWFHLRMNNFSYYSKLVLLVNSITLTYPNTMQLWQHSRNRQFN